MTHAATVQLRLVGAQCANDSFPVDTRICSALTGLLIFFVTLFSSLSLIVTRGLDPTKVASRLLAILRGFHIRRRIEITPDTPLGIPRKR
jgi:hypothetical protein